MWKIKFVSGLEIVVEANDNRLRDIIRTYKVCGYTKYVAEEAEE